VTGIGGKPKSGYGVSPENLALELSLNKSRRGGCLKGCLHGTLSRYFTVVCLQILDELSNSQFNMCISLDVNGKCKR